KEVIRIPRADVAPPAPSFSMKKVDERIRTLSRLLEDPRTDSLDREMATNLLSTYKAVKDASQDPRDDYRYQRIADLLLGHLMDIEENLLLRRKRDQAPYPEVLYRLSLKRKKIFDDYISANDEGVVKGCLELEEAFGPDSLTPDIGLIFAVSLAKKGMIDEALRIGERIGRELEGMPDLVHLRSRMIGWHLSKGDRKKALQDYEKLLDNLDEREALIKKAEHGLSGEVQRSAVSGTGPAGEVPSPGPGKIKEPGPLEDTLREVDRLAQSREFDKAKLLLIQQKIRSADGPQSEIIDQALKSVEAAEREFEQEEEAKATLKKESLKIASNLIEAEEYEKAIARLDTLSREDEADAKTKELRSLAIEKIINRERNRAAKLFLMAKQARDPAKKQDLLRSSHEILKALVDKYPLSPLNQKIKDNMNRIEEELMKLKSGSG
ncbi:MAG: hypothetical protein V1758_16135, partial [Pseudomonadota bacterium]